MLPPVLGYACCRLRKNTQYTVIEELDSDFQRDITREGYEVWIVIGVPKLKKKHHIENDCVLNIKYILHLKNISPTDLFNAIKSS